MNNIFSKYLTGDKVIWVVTILLSLFSLLIVYSSTSQLSYKFRDGNTEAYIIKHALILGGGFLLMVYIHKFKINYFSRLSQIGIIVSVLLLMLVLNIHYKQELQHLKMVDLQLDLEHTTQVMVLV